MSIDASAAAGPKDLRARLAPVLPPDGTRPRRPRAGFTLVLLHHAGGSAASFAPFAHRFPADWDVLAVDLPGRMMATGERGCRSTGEAVDWLAPRLLPLLDGPYAVFGHSMGALVAYELSRRLSGQGAPPVWVGLSGAPAPGHRPGHDRRDLWPRERLVGFMRELGGTPEEVLAFPDVVDLMVRVLRGDLAVVDTYREHPGPPLACPVTVFTGADDPVATPAMTAPWSGRTTGATTACAWPGGHFYLFDHPDGVAARITRDVAGATGRPVRSAGVEAALSARTAGAGRLLVAE
ncbi:alpha/beta fold hydrolase [Streptomyces subrutilus]|uniref:thioesterase II family protein n=1 Tax=Streptomyces subrutilus TaxID=36818 RepID=UPI002E120196|nr:alpha/beta fold hydrolase [Streptomyces subrutilus]